LSTAPQNVGFDMGRIRKYRPVIAVSHYDYSSTTALVGTIHLHNFPGYSSVLHQGIIGKFIEERIGVEKTFRSICWPHC